MGARFRRASERRAWLAPALLLLVFAAPAVPDAERIAAQQARTELDRGHLPQAQRIVDDALRRFASSDSEAAWTLRVMRGEVLMQTGDSAAADKILRKPPPPRWRTSEAEVRRLIALAYIAQTHQSPETEQFIDAAHAIATKHQPALVPNVLLMRALAHPQRAEAYTLDAITLARKAGNRVTEAKALANLTKAYVGAHRYNEAIATGERARAIATELDLQSVLERAEGNVGWAYWEVGDDESAIDPLVRAEAIAARTHSAGRIAWLVLLGDIYYARHDLAAAERFYRDVVTYGAKDANDVGSALANLAVIAIRRGQYDEARRFNSAATAIKKTNHAADAELRSRILDARISAAQGKTDDAVRVLQSVLGTATDVRTRWEAEGRLGEAYGRAKRASDAVAAFDRALALIRKQRAATTDPELRLSFYNPSKEIFDAYVDYLAGSGRAADALAVTETSRGTIEEGLGNARASAPLDARAVARQQNATLVSYWIGTERSWVWSATPDAVTVAPLDATVDTAAETYRRNLLGARGTLQLSGNAGQRLFTLLVPPAAAALRNGARVIVIADGKLHALNFETLVAPKPAPHYWIEDVTLVAAGSLRLLPRAQTANSAKSMLLVGNPPQVAPEFPPLQFARAELDNVARHFPPAHRKVLAGPEATPAAYRGASPERFAFVHFVAHGVATRKRPLDSSVILGNDATKHYRLFARDIVLQPLHARLVTISSCHGAGTRAFTGEGLVGLAWAFLRAGASNVIAALWEVDDRTTPQLMNRMYDELDRGRDPASALRIAKLEIERAQTIYRQPRYWATFVVYAGS
ncbi:MAG: CHAT domain-containing protein [Acidobacteria bacterium]|nr:CHAT domain-containing protein [Acidobacteriota bacterium]MBV9475793.1 CHAT domain-containing protein [Acidobacteriota bacterium]